MLISGELLASGSSRSLIALLEIAYGAHLKHNELPGQQGSTGALFFRRAYGQWLVLTVKLDYDTLAAGLLICNYLERANHSTASAIMVGALTSMSHLMGLHRDPAGTNLSLQEKNYRCSLFWNLVILQDAIGWNRGSSGFELRLCDQPYPVPLPDKPKTCLDCYYPSIAASLADLSLEILNGLYASGSRKTSYSSLESQVNIYSTKLERIRDSILPDSLKPLSTQSLSAGVRPCPGFELDVIWSGFHIRYYHTVLQIFRITLLTDSEQENAFRVQKPLSRWEKECRQTVLASCRLILHISPSLKTPNSHIVQTSTGGEYQCVNKAIVILLVDAITRSTYSDGVENIKLVQKSAAQLLSAKAIKASERHHSAVTFLSHFALVAELAVHGHS